MVVVTACLFALAVSPARAQVADTKRLFSADAIRRAVERVAPNAAQQIVPSDSWSRVERLAAGTEIMVRWGGSLTPGRFISADAATLTFLPGAQNTPQTLSKAGVEEVSAPARRGSKAGAVVGAAAGVFAGFYAAFGLAFKDCGRSCRDERVLIPLSIIGIPIAGGVAGFYAFASHGLRTIYRSPARMLSWRSHADESASRPSRVRLQPSDRGRPGDA